MAFDEVDLTEERLASLREKERILDLIFTSSGDLVFLYRVDREGCCRSVSMNTAFIRHLNKLGITTPEDSMIGLTREELYVRWGVPHAGFEASESFFQNAIRGKIPVTYEVDYSRPGNPQFFSIILSPSIDRQGVITHLLWVAHDITAVKRSENAALEEKTRLEKLVATRTQELRAALERAESGSRAKSDFLSRMSHELRTPMHAILSFAELGRDQALASPPDKLRGFFSNIHQAGAQMLELLNDLLDLSRLEARKMVFDLAPCRVAPVVDEVLEILSAQIRGKKMTVIAQIPPDLSLSADRARLSQIFRNLLSNAVKYSPEETVVTVGAAVDPDGRRVDLTVADHGYGIPDGELETIFDRFTQSSRTRTGAGGSGLGLAICRELVLAHGGRIWAEHHSGGGTVFHLSLPMDGPAKETI
jgi:signal transduction histidine kinase